VAELVRFAPSAVPHLGESLKVSVAATGVLSAPVNRDAIDIAADVSAVGLWHWDLASGRLYLDSRSAAAAGVADEAPADELIARSIHSDDLPGFRAAVTSALGSPHIVTRHVRLAGRDGTWRTVEMRLKVGRDATGKAASIVIGVTDLPDDERASKAARQAEAERALVDRLSVATQAAGIYVWEFDWTTLALSWDESRLSGARGKSHIAHAMGTDFFKWVHPDDQLVGAKAMEEAVARGDSDSSFRYRVCMPDGGVRHIQAFARTYLDAQGKPLRSLGVSWDVTNEVLAAEQLAQQAEELRNAQARFDRAVNGTQDGLWEADAVRGTMWLARRTSALLGYEEGELGTHLTVLRDRMHPEDLPEADASLKVALEGGLPVDRELRLQTKDGSWRWFRVRGKPDFGPDGTVHRMSGSIQDVTDARAQRDALIEASEAANAASRSKSAFIANVSHEIRTPMNGIIGMTSLLLDTQLDRSQREYAETIRASADALLTVINDILDFSKIEAGKLDIETIEMDLPGNVEDVGSTLAFQAAAKGLELIVNVQPDVPALVTGDPQRIRQCLINLIGNAIKFTRSGEIAVEVSRDGGTEETPRIRFEVRDTGIGIAADAVESLFQPFVQADVSTTRNFGGTGLGLSIVKRLVELMDGEVGVRSVPNEGSTFWFVLPMPVVTANLPSTSSGQPRTGRRVLVVDDNETNRRVIATRLAHAGYDVALASSGREALVTMRLALAASRGFDLVLSDFQMPDMDGAMLGERINADPALSHSRVVLLTSVDRQGDLSRFASMGFAGYLTKPIRARELLACLEKVLEHEAQAWHSQTHPIVTANCVPRRAAAKPYSGKVLLVEDNVVNQKVGRRFLERLGCEVVLAENGVQALEAWKREEFRLVLMDVQMPEMDGYTATRTIRDLEKGRMRTPIVALTANAMTGQLERCLQCGMDGLLTKPLDPERLEEVLDRFGLGLPEDALHTQPARA